MENITDMLVLEDGRILATSSGGSETALIRLLPDGAVDTSFGTGGRVTSGAGTGYRNPSGVVQDNAGRFLTANTEPFGVTRFLPDGSVDASFGSNGTTQITFYPGNTERATSLAVQSDGAVVVGGYSSIPNQFGEWTLARLKGADAPASHDIVPGLHLGATVTATLSRISGEDVVIQLAFGGSATQTVDYATSSSQIVVPAGALTGVITLTAIQDSVVDPAEFITTDISAVSGGTENGVQRVSITITDDEPTTGSIAGTAFEDINGNGQREITEPGLAGITIYLDLNGNGVFDNVPVEFLTNGLGENGVEPSVITDANGNYVFTDVPGGSYLVREVVPRGYQLTFPVISPAHRVTVTPNAVQENVDFGNQRKRLTLSILDSAISENGGTTTATVSRGADTANPLVVTLFSSDTTEATVVGTVTIPAGETTSPAFTISGVDDALADGNQLVSITANSADSQFDSAVDSHGG